jgi:hypothetical protein
MNDRKVNILGTEYIVKEKKIAEDELLDSRDGYTDWTTREIVVRREQEQEEGSLKNMDAYIREVVRHEIIHAFLFESGLDASANSVFGSWAKNEEMVDWFAIQGQKIYKAWQDVGCLD